MERQYSTRFVGEANTCLSMMLLVADCHMELSIQLIDWIDTIGKTFKI
ncbi:hypothetical protein BSU04_13705 [Caballeronia sordidicola]|uniref:Uncharacterized protein n=1 Tax=Caballeronia sordidicola TaxID=196367 RepID=A0A226X404_CABSO|nr:hypothetical protein BSU04_13705 [Caballeronia sordidicola]